MIQQTDVIIWDEAPMTNKFCMEALDRTLKDLMNSNAIFGGKVIVFGGDFRQILPVVQRGSRGETVEASLKRSYLWQKIKVLPLTENMRLGGGNQQFADFLLRIGNGTERSNDHPGMIQIPAAMLPSTNTLLGLIRDTLPNILGNWDSTAYWTDRMILTCRNKDVDLVNHTIADMVPGEFVSYNSADSIQSDTRHDYRFQAEFLNTLMPSGLPPHCLKLKVGLPIVLLRNLNPRQGLCNGTRLIIKRLLRNVIEAEICVGRFSGNIVFIHRIDLISVPTELPFQLRRRQFPVRLSMAMTINKAQGQTVCNLGLYLPSPVFSHGQLYVAMSRVRDQNSLKILSISDEFPPDFIKNIVFREIFD